MPDDAAHRDDVLASVSLKQRAHDGLHHASRDTRHTRASLATRHTRADLRAKESVCQNRVIVEAVGESDELQTVDNDHVTSREHDVVHAVHVERGGAEDAAGKAPFASEKNRVPRRDNSRGRA